MYIVARISIILVSHCVLAKASKIATKPFTISTNFPSRLYLPTSPNPGPKNRARTSDIDAVLENDLQVIPLVEDHDRRNEFQYQPIISRQYSRGFTESPWYSQSATPKHLLAGDTRRLGSPISNANEVKPITKSQLSHEAVGYSFKPKGNWGPSGDEEDSRRASFSCLGRFRTNENPLDQTPGNPPRWKTLTVNNQENNTHRERQRLQLTPPRVGISRISRYRIGEVSPPESLTKSIVVSDSWSKEKKIFSDHSSSTCIDRDVKPIFEINEYGINHNNYNQGGYQLGNLPTPDSTAASSNDPLPSKIAAELTCNDILRGIPLQHYKGYNYGYNTRQHPTTNQILALLLSHYGRYLPGIREPRVYAHMAVNNIHNNKPFGSYKLTTDDDA